MEDNSIEKCHLLSLQFFLELLSTKVILPMKTDDHIFCEQPESQTLFLERDDAIEFL